MWGPYRICIGAPARFVRGSYGIPMGVCKGFAWGPYEVCKGPPWDLNGFVRDLYGLPQGFARGPHGI